MRKICNFSTAYNPPYVYVVYMFSDMRMFLVTIFTCICGRLQSYLQMFRISFPFRICIFVLHMRFSHICQMQPFFQSAFMQKICGFNPQMRPFSFSKRIYATVETLSVFNIPCPIDTIKNYYSRSNCQYFATSPLSDIDQYC